MQKVLFLCLSFLTSFLAGTAKAQTSVRSSTYPLIALWSFRELSNMPTPPVAEATTATEAPAETTVPVETTAPAEAPAEMAVSFSTERLGTGALLKWDLPQRDDVTSLVIETSEDGQIFTDLEALKDAEAGAVNVYYDAEPQTRRFYRLVANYKDGRQHITPAGNILPPPVPTPDFVAAFDSTDGDLLTVHSPEPVEIYNWAGKRLLTASLEDDVYVIDFTGLPANEYYLVRSGDHKQKIFYNVPIALEMIPEAIQVMPTALPAER